MYKFLLLFPISFALTAAVTINNVNINEIAVPGQLVQITLKENNNIAFCFKDNNLNVGSVEINNIRGVEEGYKNLLENIDKLFIYKAGDNLIFDREKIFCRENLFLIGLNVLISAKNKFSLSSSIIRANAEIYITTNECIFNNCFISNAKYLYIKAIAEDSLIQFLRFKFSPNLPFYLLQGDLRLKDFFMNRNFIVYGANKMEIMFHPNAYN